MKKQYNLVIEKHADVPVSYYTTEVDVESFETLEELKAFKKDFEKKHKTQMEDQDWFIWGFKGEEINVEEE